MIIHILKIEFIFYNCRWMGKQRLQTLFLNDILEESFLSTTVGDDDDKNNKKLKKI